MKRSIQFPMRLESENRHRRQHWAATASKTAKERRTVGLVLSQLPRSGLVVGDRANSFAVTLTRIFSGTLDDDNLAGSMKAVRDEVAAWLGLDDRDRRVRWAYRQFTCERGKAAVKIEIDDDEQGQDCERVLGAAPTRLAAPSADRLGRKGRKDTKPAALEQVPITFARAWALLPWEQSSPDEPVFAELPFRCLDGPPPPTARVRGPPGCAAAVLVRRPATEDEQRVLEGSAWVYETETTKGRP